MNHKPDPVLLQKARKIRLLLLDADGVLTDGRLYFGEDGQELKAFHSRDGLGLKALIRFGIRVGIITGRTSQLLLRRCEQLGIDLVYQGQENKLVAYRELLEQLNLQDEEVCFAGDDWTDLPVLQRAGLAVTVADADPEVLKRCHWVTVNGGGRGAVREICDLLLDSQGYARQWLHEILANDE